MKQTTDLISVLCGAALASCAAAGDSTNSRHTSASAEDASASAKDASASAEDASASAEDASTGAGNAAVDTACSATGVAMELHAAMPYTVDLYGPPFEIFACLYTDGNKIVSRSCGHRDWWTSLNGSFVFKRRSDGRCQIRVGTECLTAKATGDSTLETCVDTAPPAVGMSLSDHQTFIAQTMRMTPSGSGYDIKFMRDKRAYEDNTGECFHFDGGLTSCNGWHIVETNADGATPGHDQHHRRLVHELTNIDNNTCLDAFQTEFNGTCGVFPIPMPTPTDQVTFDMCSAAKGRLVAFALFGRACIVPPGGSCEITSEIPGQVVDAKLCWFIPKKT